MVLDDIQDNLVTCRSPSGYFVSGFVDGSGTCIGEEELGVSTRRGTWQSTDVAVLVGPGLCVTGAHNHSHSGFMEASVQAAPAQEEALQACNS